MQSINEQREDSKTVDSPRKNGHGKGSAYLNSPQHHGRGGSRGKKHQQHHPHHHTHSNGNANGHHHQQNPHDNNPNYKIQLKPFSPINNKHHQQMNGVITPVSMSSDNDDKRSIYLLRPEYVSIVMSDMREIMSYTDSSQYVNRKLKKGDNIRIVEPR